MLMRKTGHFMRRRRTFFSMAVVVTALVCTSGALLSGCSHAPPSPIPFSKAMNSPMLNQHKFPLIDAAIGFYIGQQQISPS